MFESADINPTHHFLYTALTRLPNTVSLFEYKDQQANN